MRMVVELTLPYMVGRSSTMAGRGAWPLVTAGSLRNRDVTFRTQRSGGGGESEKGEHGDEDGSGTDASVYGGSVLHDGRTMCLPPA